VSLDSKLKQNSYQELQFVLDKELKEWVQKKIETDNDLLKLGYNYAKRYLEVPLENQYSILDCMNLAHGQALFHYEQYIRTKMVTLVPNKFNVAIEDTVFDRKKINKNKPVAISLNIKKGKKEKLRVIYRNLSKYLPQFVHPDTDEETFVRIMSSDNLLTEEGSIHFICDNVQAEYIFRKMKPLFNDLTPARIHSSEKFYNENGKLMRKGDLYTAKSQNSSGPKEKDQIDKAFNI
jgi:hypothetical protein